MLDRIKSKEVGVVPTHIVENTVHCDRKTWGYATHWLLQIHSQEAAKRSSGQKPPGLYHKARYPTALQ